MRTTVLKISGIIAAVALTACTQSQLRTIAAEHNDDSFAVAGYSRPISDPGSGGLPDRPTSGGSGVHGCDWENYIDFNQCETHDVNTSDEVMTNTSGCRVEGDTLIANLHIRGIIVRNQEFPVSEHFSRKSGAKVTIYDFTRYCSGGKMVIKHNDDLYKCSYAKDFVCRFGQVVE